MDPALTYGSYLKLDELLALQSPRSEGPEHDELLFIIIHQVYELWFRQILHELDRLVELLGRDDFFGAAHTLGRILKIFKVLVAQLDILETMTPLQFLSFRARLEAASGFQSDQFRQLEFLLGRKREEAVERFPEGSRARQALAGRYLRPTLWDAFLGHLARRGHPVPPGLLERDVREPLAPSEELQVALVRVYHEDPQTRALCELLVDLDEGIQEWRYRHVKMVERTLGGRPGTGGSSGAAYLRGTLSPPLFPDLWEIRSRL